MSARSCRAWLSCSLLFVAAGATAGEVADHADFTGRTEAAVTVEVRARVTGYLVKVAFKDGAEVKQGDLLFEIDPRPYQAELDRANAALAAAEAHLKRADTELKRAKALIERSAMSKEDYDKVVGDVDEARAQVAVARASREVANLNLDFTKVTAPVSGRVGRRLVDSGNVVRADGTMLTTIVGKDPMYVYFDVDERTYLDLRRALRDGKVKAAKLEDLPVAVQLANEEGFPHQGKLDFVDNRADPTKGTIRMRAVLPNADGLLVPGLFAQVRLTTADKK
jgi:RND family efflux transporter MFP subunit